jgi:hypothetical protein
MRFYGKLIAQVCGQTKGKHLLVDRIVAVYVSKKKVRIYLCDYTYKYWYKNCHILDIVEVAINKRPIKDIVTEQINNLATKNEIKFENFAEKFGNLK